MFFLKILVSGIVGGVVLFGWVMAVGFLFIGVETIAEYFGFDIDLSALIDYRITLGIGGILSVASFLFILWKLRNWGSKKFCAWCGEKSGLTKEKEYEGNYVWAYPNKDGSPDKRVEDNYEEANYFTFWRCKKCSALTKFQHNMDKNPSSSVKVIQVMLSEDGEGERTVKDWAEKGVHSVSGVRE